jgi:hypothetical protein
LLICHLHARQSLIHQGFDWTARKKSTVLNLYESTTCVRHGLRGNSRGRLGFLPRRNTTFVHKSSLKKAWLQAFPLDMEAGNTYPRIFRECP